MSFFDEIILNTIFILFPIFFYLIYFATKNNLPIKERKLVLDIGNLFSLYFILKYNTHSNIIVLLVNIPLLISIIKGRKLFSIILSVLIVLYYNELYSFSIFWIILEYTFYLIYFYIIKKKYNNYENVLNSFIFIKGAVLIIENLYLSINVKSPTEVTLQVLFVLIVFYFISIFILLLLDKGEKIISLNHILKELEKEKTLKISLFKITHEVKNPLSVCKGYLSMMNYSDIEKVKKYNKIIKNEIDRTLDIMDAFSEYTKINIKLNNINIIDLMDEVIDTSKILLKSKNINLKFDKDNNDIFIDADYNRLKQVFVNIIKNSVEAIEEDGKINIAIKENKKNIKIEIIDNGVGMDEETLKKFGEMFYTTKNNGTGIGVSLSKEIIELHNGIISYESSINKGTKVIIFLPKSSLHL